jgi:hypothetical protein
VLLAVSPIHMIVSRTAAADAIALFALTLLAVAAARLDEGGRLGHHCRRGVKGLTTAPLFYSGLLAFLPAWWVYRGAAGPGWAAAGRGWAAGIVFRPLPPAVCSTRRVLARHSG